MSNEQYRPFRLEIRGALKVSTFHIGSGANFSLTSDSPILRDQNGRPYLPATSLKGVIRSHLEAEFPGLDRLFGVAEKENGSALSRITVYDATSVTSPGTEVRDHVRIKPEWAAAADGGKFDQEVSGPATLKFHLIYEGGSKDDAELCAIQEAVRALQAGELTCGANSSRGYGRLTLAETRYISFQRSEIAGLSAWLNHRLKPVESKWETAFAWRANALEANETRWSTLELHLRIICDGPVLVRAPIPPNAAPHPFDADNPEVYALKGRLTADHVPVTTGPDNEHYLPGASLRGVLRHQACRIARLLGTGAADLLFGTINAKNDTGRKGRIEVADAPLLGQPRFVYIDHVAIDRITGFAADKRKFSTCALQSPKFDTMIRVRFKPDELHLVALFGFLLRDLQDGRLFCGGATSRGYGHMKTAQILSVTADLAFPIDDTPLPASLKPNRQRFYKQGAEFADLNFLWAITQTAQSQGAPQP